MNTIHSDFAAFKARVLSSPRAIERRNDPNTMDALVGAMEKIGGAFEQFKKAQGDTVDELRRSVDAMERKLGRPGALAGSLSADSDKTEERMQVNGIEAPVLRGADQLKSHFMRKGGSADAFAHETAGIGLANFVRGVAGMGTTPEVRAVLNTGTDTDGGFVVPARLMGTVLGALVPQSSLLSLGAGILPLEGDGQGAKSFTMAAVDTIPSAAWRSENGAVAESSPGFRGVVMAPKSLSFYFKVSREWLADAVGIDSVLTMAIAQAFAKELDRAGLRGSGTAPEPRGILNTSGILAVSSGANGATSAVAKYFNLTAGVQSIMEANGPMPNGAIMTPRSLVGFANQTDTTGQSLTRLQLLDGITFKTTTQIPNNLTVGTSTDCSEIYLGDFSKLVFAMREQMSIQLLKETFATSGQVAFLCHVRADVAVLYPKAFAVITGVRP